MIDTIWKYPIQVRDSQKISMPYTHNILCVQVQNDEPCLWVEVNSDHPLIDVEILVYGTGHKINQPGKSRARYIGTFQLMDGQFVGHVYVRE